MEIHNEYRPIDPATRKRQTEVAARSPQAAPASAGHNDQVDLTATSPAAIARYVQILKSMNPADLHRVEQLRQRISDGSYSASAEELSGPLSDLFGSGDAPRGVAPKPRA